MTQNRKLPAAAKQQEAKAIVSPKCKNTKSIDQRSFIIKQLEKRACTSYDLRDMGIAAPAVRIWELRQKGQNIKTNRIEITDSAGVKHVRIALYVLISPAKT